MLDFDLSYERKPDLTRCGTRGKALWTKTKLALIAPMRKFPR